MKRFVMVLGLLAGVFAGVAQGDQAATPPPTGGEDMRVRIVYICMDSCQTSLFGCYDDCNEGGHPASSGCNRDCTADWEACNQMCSDIFGGPSGGL